MPVTEDYRDTDRRGQPIMGLKPADDSARPPSDPNLTYQEIVDRHRSRQGWLRRTWDYVITGGAPDRGIPR